MWLLAPFAAGFGLLLAAAVELLEEDEVETILSASQTRTVPSAPADTKWRLLADQVTHVTGEEWSRSSVS